MNELVFKEWLEQLTQDQRDAEYIRVRNFFLCTMARFALSCSFLCGGGGSNSGQTYVLTS